MARNAPPASPSPKMQLNPAAITRALTRIDDRIAELEKFEISTLAAGRSPELNSLEVAIKDTLTRCFGEGTTASALYARAAKLNYYPMVMGGGPIDYATPTKRNISDAVALLKRAKQALHDDLIDQEDVHIQAPIAADAKEPSKRVFIVHGHDEAARETVARFIERLGLIAVILHEQANKGRTIIEKFEAHGDAGFAIVLLTPDDEGCVKGEVPVPRARQNVLLELGYFIGRLGRHRVCALKRGDVEIPTDLLGVVWTPMDNDGWKQALALELQAADYSIDWNRVMVV